MEALKRLEERLASLVELVKELKSVNVRLKEEKTQLEARLEILEETVKADVQRLEELNQKRMLAELMVDEMLENIECIGSAVEIEKTVVARSHE